MQENAIYSVISPEGCAAILWRDASEAKKAAAAFKPDARHCLDLGVIDGDRPRAGRRGARRITTLRRRSSPTALDARARGGRERDPDVARGGRRRGGSMGVSVEIGRPQFHRVTAGSALCPCETFHRGGSPQRFVNVPRPREHRPRTPTPPDRHRPLPARPRSKHRSGMLRVVARLDEYERKRDPAETPEPFGGKRRERKEPIFVVQRHAARRLHYDFRLERDGALASWAVPKGVPLETGERHLAVHVEDHPLDYATFEGEIPAGQYGAGTVEIWDEGTYELVEEKPDGGLTVRLHGERLQGLWTLVPAQARRRPEELAPDPQARRADAPRPRRKTALRADARDARRGAAAGRAGSSRSSGTATGRSRTCAGGERRAAQPRRPGSRPSASRRSRARSRRRSARRTASSTARSARSTSEGAAELLGHAAGRRHARLLRLRPARARRRAARRPAAHASGASGSTRSSTAAARPCGSRRPSTTARRSRAR